MHRIAMKTALKTLAAAFLLCSTLWGHAQLSRQFPADAASGLITPTSAVSAKVDDNEFRGAPGLRVLSEQNQLVPLASLNPATPVRYRLDLYGQLLTVWVLSPSEQNK